MADYVKKDILRGIGIKEPLCWVCILTYGLVKLTTCKEASYMHEDVKGALVQGDIPEGNQSISPDIQWAS